MPETPINQTRYIPTNKIKCYEEPGRADHADQDLDGLIRGIEQIGLLHPITVVPEGDEFRCLAGARRLAACRALGWEHIPAVIRTDCDENDLVAIPALENLERRQLDPWQEAQMCKDALQTEPDLDNLAKLIHRSRSWIETRLALLTWPQDALDCLRSGTLSMTAISPLAAIPDAGARSFYLEQALVGGANSRTTAQWASAWKAEAATRPTTPSAFPTGTDRPAVPATPPTGICLSCGVAHNLNELSHMPVCPPCLGAIKTATAAAEATAHKDAAAAAASETDG